MKRFGLKYLKRQALTWLVACLVAIVAPAGCSPRSSVKGTKTATTWTCDESADRAMLEDDYATAVELHRQFLEKNPQNALALYHLGFVYGQMGRHAEEVDYYEHALATGFTGDDILFNLGMAYGELDQTDASIQAFKRAIENDPGSADNYFGLAMAYQAVEKGKLAEEAYLQALDIDPAHVDSLLYLTILYRDEGRLSEARVTLRRLLEIDPDDPTVQSLREDLGEE